MFYITNSNLEQLAGRIRIKDANFIYLDKKLERELEKEQIFSQYEIDELLLIKNLILHRNEFIEKNKEAILKNIMERPKDKYLLNNSKPAYHLDENCKFLKKDYKNIEFDRRIPKEIIDEYRAWILKYIDYLKSDDEIHEARFNILHIGRWGKEINLPKEIEPKKNSGSCAIECFNLTDVEEIKNLIRENEKSSEKRQVIMDNIKWSFLASKEDEEIKKKIIIEYKEQFKRIHEIKKVIRKKLVQYFLYLASKQEQNGFYSEEVLKELGFKLCSHCGKVIVNK